MGNAVQIGLQFVDITRSGAWWLASVVFFATVFLATVKSPSKPMSARIATIVDAAWVFTSVSAFILATWLVVPNALRRNIESSALLLEDASLDLEKSVRKYDSLNCPGLLMKQEQILPRCFAVLRISEGATAVAQASRQNRVTSIPPIDVSLCDELAIRDDQDFVETCWAAAKINFISERLNGQIKASRVVNVGEIVTAIWVWFFPAVGGLRLSRSMREFRSRQAARSREPWLD